MKTRLRLDAELDLLNKDELRDELNRATKWLYDAAYGVAHIDIPKMSGAISGGSLNLGADQAEQVFCGPKSGRIWSVLRISVDGLATGDAVKVWKDTRFIGWISYQPGFITFGRGACMLSDGDYLRVTGTGLTATGTVSVYGDALTAPGPFMWKIAT